MPGFMCRSVLRFDTMAGKKPTERRQFREAMRLHNEGEHYEAHEAWEELWIDEEESGPRLLLQGLIQVTSAFHKLFHQRMPGSAGRLLARGLEKLVPYPADHLGLDLGTFRLQAQKFLPACAAWEKDPAAFEAFLRSSSRGNASSRESFALEVPRLRWL